MEEDLRQAIELIKAGNKNKAVPILKAILKKNRNEESAWLWLSVCTDTTEDKKYCLKEALRINPSNKHAKETLAQLDLQSNPQSAIDDLRGKVLPGLPITDIQKNLQSVSTPINQPAQSNTPIAKGAVMTIKGYIIIIVLLAIGIWVIKSCSTAISHKNNNCIAITSKFAYPDYQLGYSKIGGEIQNNCGHTVSYVKLQGIVYDGSGTQIGSETSYASNNIIGNGESTGFEIIIWNATNMRSYSVEVKDWTDE